MKKERLVMRRFAKVAFWSLLGSLLPTLAWAQVEGAAHAAGGSDSTWGYALGAGIAIGFAGLGCGIGQGLTAGNTTAGIARNPGAASSMNTPFILGMVLIESIAIYGLLIGLILAFKF
jgi:F-type H+-transporting ATPase subunit c